MASKKQRYNLKQIHKKLEAIENAAKAPDEKLPLSANIQRSVVKYPTQLTRTAQDILSYRSALITAEQQYFPNRTPLLRLYKDVMLDAHLYSVIETRKNAILGCKYIVTKNGIEKKELTDFINKGWLYDFITYAMDSKWWGYSLIQFGSFINDKFECVELVERQYVVPEMHLVTEFAQTFIGVDYTQDKYKKWVIPVGKERDLGLLSLASPLYLWKKNAEAAWSEYVTLYGAPYRVIKTHVRDELTRGNAEAMLRDMGTSLYAVMDIEDEFELVDVNKNSAAEIFENLINLCDAQMSKLILGNTTTSDQGKYVGASDNHFKVTQMVNESDKRFITTVLNDLLIPLLNLHGLGFEKLRIDIEPDDTLTLKEKSDIDIGFAKYYTIDPEYILKTYGTPVVARPESSDNKTDSNNVTNRLAGYYGTE